MTYARGKHAFGFCDRTGFRYPLADLVYEYRNGKRTGMRVGKDVLDKDHPQNFIGKFKHNDPQSLRDPRPDRFSESVTVNVPGLTEGLLPQVVPAATGSVGVVFNEPPPQDSATLATVLANSAVGIVTVNIGEAVDDGGDGGLTSNNFDTNTITFDSEFITWDTD